MGENERLARIETKLDILLQTKDDTEQRMRRLESGQIKLYSWVTLIAGGVSFFSSTIIKKLFGG